MIERLQRSPAFSDPLPWLVTGSWGGWKPRVGAPSHGRDSGTQPYTPVRRWEVSFPGSPLIGLARSPAARGSKPVARTRLRCGETADAHRGVESELQGKLPALLSGSPGAPQVSAFGNPPQAYCPSKWGLLSPCPPPLPPAPPLLPVFKLPGLVTAYSSSRTCWEGGRKKSRKWSEVCCVLLGHQSLLWGGWHAGRNHGVPWERRGFRQMAPPLSEYEPPHLPGRGRGRG